MTAFHGRKGEVINSDAIGDFTSDILRRTAAAQGSRDLLRAVLRYGARHNGHLSISAVQCKARLADL